MEEYEAEEIELTDELAQEYEVSYLLADNLMKVVEFLGYTQEEARRVVSNNVATIFPYIVGYWLHRMFKSGKLHDLPAILKRVKLNIAFIDDCQILHFSVPQSPPLDEKIINKLRTILGPYYPDKVRKYTIEIGPANGRKLTLVSYNLLEARQLDHVFEHYSQWFEQQSRWVSPQFERINKTLTDWLYTETRGIRVQQDDFIDWFITNKLGRLAFDFTLTFDKTTGYIVEGSSVPVRFHINSLAENITPSDIHDDYIEFGLWLEERAKSSKQSLLVKRALTPKLVSNSRSENIKRLAGQAVGVYEYQIEEIVKRENGKLNPLSDKAVVKEAVDKYLVTAIGRNFGLTQKSLDRYIKDTGKEGTAKEYGRQLVRQFRRINI